ncbi:hypothetical protein SK128_006962, partial [Halocaridina rubra]
LLLEHNAITHFNITKYFTPQHRGWNLGLVVGKSTDNVSSTLTLAPITTTTLAPAATVTLVPATTMTLAPATTTTLAPVTTTTMSPTTAVTVAPTTTSTVAPTTTTTFSAIPTTLAPTTVTTLETTTIATFVPTTITTLAATTEVTLAPITTTTLAPATTANGASTTATTLSPATTTTTTLAPTTTTTLAPTTTTTLASTTTTPSSTTTIDPSTYEFRFYEEESCGSKRAISTISLKPLEPKHSFPKYIQCFKALTDPNFKIDKNVEELVSTGGDGVSPQSCSGNKVLVGFKAYNNFNTGTETFSSELSGLDNPPYLVGICHLLENWTVNTNLCETVTATTTSWTGEADSDYETENWDYYFPCQLFYLATKVTRQLNGDQWQIVSIQCCAIA